MRIKKNGTQGLITASTVAISLIAFNGCSSSSSTPAAPVQDDSTARSVSLSGNAIDGFIVGGNIYCDGTANGTTGAKGAYSCPEGTTLVNVKNGFDVGYNADETEEGLPFLGSLSGPANNAYITPITTLVVLLATNSAGEYDPSKLEEAKETLKKALGLDSLDISTNPESDIATARLNTQVSSIASAFAATEGDYNTLMDTFAGLLKTAAQNNETFDISGNDSDNFSALMEELNNKLVENGTELGRSEEFDDFVDNIRGIVRTVENTNNHHDFIKEVTDLPITAYALGIYKAKEAVQFEEAPFQESPSQEFGQVENEASEGQSYIYNMINYITPDRNNNGCHQITLNNGINHVSFFNDAITVQKTLNQVPLDIGLKIESEDDSREINLIGRGALVSMVTGDSSSVNFEVPDGMEWQVSAVAADGTKVYTKLSKSGDRIFSSGNGNSGLEIDFDAISTRLGNAGSDFSKQQYLDLTQETGHFKVTFVLDGIKVAKIVTPTPTQEIVYSAWGYNVSVENNVTSTIEDSLYAPGWEGYFTITGPGISCDGSNNNPA